MTIMTIQLNAIAKVRIWFGERPTSGFPAKGVLFGSAASGGDGPHTNPIGIEAFVPRGGMAEYGLLSVEFQPTEGRALQIEVPHSEMGGAPWVDTLAGKVDDVRLGLPQEYAIAVVTSMSSASAGRYRSGVLRVTDAVHGMVGSTPNFFGRLGRAAVELELANEDVRVADRLAAVLRPILID
jgi:hypothetical protein